VALKRQWGKDGKKEREKKAEYREKGSKKRWMWQRAGEGRREAGGSEREGWMEGGEG